jgi:hypothetical protein
MRLAYLFLRTRQAGHTVALLGTIAVAAGLWHRLSAGDNLSVYVLLLIPPLAAAGIIGASAHTPLHELEAPAAHPLAPLRLGHLVALLLVAALGLIVARGAPDWAIVRNVAGFAGLALLTARVAGSAAAWVVPFGYGVIALWADPALAWAWPIQAASERDAMAIAAALAVAGLGVIARWGARERMGEAA